MVRRKLRTALVVGAVILLATGIFVALSPTRNQGQGRVKLPFGQGTPAICLSQSHGLILASDGGLSSWGSDFLGWPVLGLGKVNAQTRGCVAWGE